MRYSHVRYNKFIHFSTLSLSISSHKLECRMVVAFEGREFNLGRQNWAIERERGREGVGEGSLQQMFRSQLSKQSIVNMNSPHNYSKLIFETHYLDTHTHAHTHTRDVHVGVKLLTRNF